MLLSYLLYVLFHCPVYENSFFLFCILTIGGGILFIYVHIVLWPCSWWKLKWCFCFDALNFYISSLLYTSIGFTLADVYVILKILFGGKKYNHAFVSCCVYIFIEGTICPEIFLCQLEFVLKCKINFSWIACGCCFKQKLFSMLEKNKGIYFRT